jgi:hypothetical protein
LELRFRPVNSTRTGKEGVLRHPTSNWAIPR